MSAIYVFAFAALAAVFYLGVGLGVAGHAEDERGRKLDADDIAIVVTMWPFLIVAKVTGWVLRKIGGRP